MLCGCCGGAGAGTGAGGVRLLLPCSLVAIVDAMTRDGCMHQCGGGNSGPEKRVREEVGDEHTSICLYL